MNEPFMFIKLAEKDTTSKAMEDLLPGAGAGVLATFITNPIGQIGNMKSSHPETYANKSTMEVARSLYNKVDKVSGKKMGLKAFYAGFGTQALKNALFSGVMFASVPVVKALVNSSTSAAKKGINKLQTNE